VISLQNGRFHFVTLLKAGAVTSLTGKRSKTFSTASLTKRERLSLPNTLAYLNSLAARNRKVCNLDMMLKTFSYVSLTKLERLSLACEANALAYLDSLVVRSKKVCNIET
jgi:hypothetical protein